MADVVLCAASAVAGCLVAPVNRLCGYVKSYDSHVRELKAKVAELRTASDRVQDSIRDAQNNVKPIKHYVNQWVKDVEKHAEEACRVLDDKAKITCFRGWLPNLKVRYRLGREARRKAERIQGLINQTPSGKVYDDPPPGLVDGASDGASNVISSAGDRGDIIFDSRASILEEIMNALDDEKHKVIGIYGEGGVGKTTLLKQVEEKLRNEKRLFRVITKANVSPNPDLKKIQDDIAYALSLKNLKDEPSEEGRKDLLFKRLQKDPGEKILIILDDLWKELDLREVGIPSGDESKGCKLLLTSRFKNVIEQMKCDTPIFHLEALKYDEAFSLFEKTVGNRLKDDEELRAIAPEVVKKLAGLPLLIISVACTLKHSDVSAWRIALKKIDSSQMETIVKLSYDHLKSECTKALFLLCCLIGGTIQAEILLVLGMGLGLFEELGMTIQDSRDGLNTMLDELRSVCLLLNGGDDKNNVTIHDLYNEMVVSKAFSGQNSLIINSNYGSWPKEKLEKCWACLVNVGGDRLAELMLRRFPHVKILMFSERNDMGDCSGIDFTYMEELRALCLSSIRITSFPSSMGILKDLRSLSIDCRVEDVANLSKLKALQILSFAGSIISKLPKEIGELTNLRSLDLSYCSLCTIEPGALKGLINLEELHMKGSFDQWTSKHEMPSKPCGVGLAELKSLTKLASLEISISSPIILLEDDDLPFGNLVRFWIDIGSASGREFGFDEGLRTLKLNLEGGLRVLSRKWVQKTLQKTQYLCLYNLSEFKKSAHELCTLGFQEVRHLEIDDSPSINYIVNSSDAFPLTAFRKLEFLLLENLINLEKICHGPVALECFSKLKVVTVGQCGQLKYLWCLLDMQRLVQLQELKVWRCDSIQSIVTHDAREDIVPTDYRVELPNVRCLVLRELPNMTSFCTEAEITLEDTPIQVSLPRLESLVMSGLLGLEKILYSGPSMKYNNLKSLHIEESKFTSSILKLDWILKLPNLESMEIENSPSVEVIFNLEELKVSGDVEILSHLTNLTLRQLPNLQRMWKDVKLHGISTFRTLKNLFVYNTGLSFLFPVSVAKCLGEIRAIYVEDCPNMEAVIVNEEGRDEGTDNIVKLPSLKDLFIMRCPTKKFFSYPLVSQDAHSNSFFDQKVSLPSLEHLSLHSVGSLKRIWHDELHESSFEELATLTLVNCSKLLNVFPPTMIGRLRNLKQVVVSNSLPMESLESLPSTMIERLCNLNEVEVSNSLPMESLESLFDCGSFGSYTEQNIVPLSKLEKVELSGARRLKHMVKSNSHTVLGFPSLTKVKVENCSELTYLFPNYTATTLEKLKDLQISKCEHMKEVVPKEEGGQSEAEVMSFPCLRSLSLQELDNLICFSSGSCSYNFASLRSLRIGGCRNFGTFIPSLTSIERPLSKMAKEDDKLPQTLFNEMVTCPIIRSLEIEGALCKELWNNQIPTDSFGKLESLKLKDCDNLQCIAPSLMWKRLQHCLEILEVISCRSTDIIYEGDEMDTESCKLRRLVLHDLENLRHIWQSDGLPNVPFPNLREVEAVRCSRLEMLFTTFTAKFLGQIEDLVVESCEDMKLIAGHEKGEEETRTTITFSKLTILRLFELPKFRSFLPEKYSLKFSCSDDFPSLQDMSIVSCGAEPDQVFGNWKSYRRVRRLFLERERQLERRQAPVRRAMGLE